MLLFQACRVRNGYLGLGISAASVALDSVFLVVPVDNSYVLWTTKKSWNTLSEVDCSDKKRWIVCESVSSG